MIIYKATNVINDKSYIGQSKFSLDKRKQQHKTMFHKSQSKFHSAIREFGWDKFNWKVLETGDIDLDEREVYYMKKFNTVENGYNKIYRGSGRDNVLRDMILKTPKNMAFTYDYFNNFDISRQSISSYVDSGWLEKLNNGLYKKRFSQISVVDLLKTEHTYGNRDLHIGGRTALSFKGQSHYIRFDEKIHIFGTEKYLNSYFDYFREEFIYYNKNLFKKDTQPNTYISIPERACIEAVEDTGLDEYENIMKGMVYLRPSIVENLLISCKSIKTKRVFLYFADKHNLPFIDKIDIDKIELGKGKRQIRKGGKLNKKFKIVI